MEIDTGLRLFFIGGIALLVFSLSLIIRMIVSYRKMVRREGESTRGGADEQEG